MRSTYQCLHCNGKVQNLSHEFFAIVPVYSSCSCVFTFNQNGFPLTRNCLSLISTVLSLLLLWLPQRSYCTVFKFNSSVYKLGSSADHCLTTEYRYKKLLSIFLCVARCDPLLSLPVFIFNSYETLKFSVVLSVFAIVTSNANFPFL